MGARRDRRARRAPAPARRRASRARTRRSGRRRWRRLTGATATLALLLVVALAAAILVPAAAGYRRYVITGDSMGDSLPKGSIAYERLVPTREIGVGDIVTYTPPGHAALVTHRVIWTGRDAHGTPALRTKGDANEVPDSWGRFTLHAREQARVAFHVPLAGYAVAALSERPVRMVVFGGPALLVAFAAFGSAWRTGRDEVAAGASP